MNYPTLNPSTPRQLSSLRHRSLVNRWDAAPKAAPGLLMREQMGWPVRKIQKTVKP
jgi:hypothetical protein